MRTTGKTARLREPVPKTALLVAVATFALSVSHGVTAQPAPAPAEEPAPGSPTARETRLRIVYSAPAPLLETYYLFSPAAVHPADLEDLGAEVRTVSFGLCAMTDGSRLLFAPDTMTDDRAVPLFLEGAATAKREVVEEDLPVLVSPYEYRFQAPYKGHVDCIRELEKQSFPLGSKPDVRREEADLVRYTTSGGQSVLALELDKGRPLAVELRDYARYGGTIAEVKTQDDEVRIYSMVRPLYRGSRVKAEIARLLQPGEEDASGLTHPDAIVYLRPGGGISHGGKAGRREFVAKQIKELAPSAIVPVAEDLWLGPEELARYAGEASLPYIAANLSKTGDGDASRRRTFPRFKIVETAGLTVGVIGAVGPSQSAILPPNLSGKWEVSPMGPALEEALTAMRRHLGRRPDLIVLLVATRDAAEYDKAMGTDGVDVVLGRWSSWQAAPTIRSLRFAPKSGGREDSRLMDALYGVRASAISVGALSVTFRKSRDDAPARLTGIDDSSRVVVEDGPRDSVLETAMRQFDEIDYARIFEVALPDLSEIAARNPEIAPLIWGERILFNRSYGRRPRSEAAALTDPLLMRLATNSAVQALGAEVAVSRDIALPSVTLGPTSRGVLERRLGIMDSIELVTLTGAELMKLAARITLQEIPGEVPPAAHLFTSGIDPIRLRVAGRTIEPAEEYRVAITDYVAALPELQEVFKGKPRTTLFGRSPDGTYRPDAQGDRLTLRTVALGRIDGWVDEKTRAFDPGSLPALEDSLLDHANRLTGRWRLRVREISAGGGQYANTSASGPAGDFTESMEARVVTPDNYSLALGADISLDYDGPLMAWETGVMSRLQRIVIEIAGQEPIEPIDDFLAYTELRLNVIGLEAGSSKVPVVPYVRSAYDTELTANPGLSRQQLLRGGVGAVAFPGPRLQEIRLGGIWQGDLSNALTNDFGLSAGYRLAWPIFAHLVWESRFDIRYLFPDDDDALKDLGLVLEAVNKLVVPIYGGLALFGSADLFFVQGKDTANRDVGGSYVLGAGLQFSDVWKF